MNEKDQRIAIAEACGWIIHGPDGVALRNPQGVIVNQHYGELWRLPDYLHDLNAMHEAEKVLPPRHEEYAIALAELLECNEESELNPWDLWKIANATSAQKAEAFLKAKDLWKD